MTVTNFRKDPEALTMSVTAEFDAPVERVWRLWDDPRLLEQMEQLVNMGVEEGMQQAMGQMDALVSA